MKLTLATAALMLTASAAFAQGTTGTTPGVAGTGAGTGSTSGAMVPGITGAPSSGAPSSGAPGSPLLPGSGTVVPGSGVNTTPQTNSTPNAGAVQTTNTTARTSAAPVPGRNSFTMGEARRRITSAGFSNVSGLKKDGQGIWRGQAQKGGASVGVSLDYQGNVVGQ